MVTVFQDIETGELLRRGAVIGPVYPPRGSKVTHHGRKYLVVDWDLQIDTDRLVVLVREVVKSRVPGAMGTKAS